MAGHECNGIWYFMGPLLLVSVVFMPIINVFLHIILAIKGWTGKIMALKTQFFNLMAIKNTKLILYTIIYY